VTVIAAREIDEIAARLVGEPVSRVIGKHTAVIAVTRRSVLKVRDAVATSEVTNLADAEAAWLRRFGRRSELVAQLVLNLEKQLSFMPWLEPYLLSAVREALHRLLSSWFGRPDTIQLALHRNMFSPNVFVGTDVWFIDPRLHADSVTSLPWFGDLATFNVDLLPHGWPGQGTMGLVPDRLDEDDCEVFTAVSIVKTLVRWRFALHERTAIAEAWRVQQNMLVCGGAESLVRRLVVVR
jgi:hypothetical protein